MSEAAQGASAAPSTGTGQGGTRRLFVALALEPAAREAIHVGAAPLRQALGDAVRWTSAPTLHVTLRFLGAQPDAAIRSLAAALRAAADAVPAFVMRLQCLGAFPSVARARVLWVGIEASAVLARLHQLAEDACASVGLPPEERQFRPHVTLGRVRQGARLDPRLVRAPELEGPVESRVHTLDLMESELALGGARHRALARFPLADTPLPTPAL